MLALRTLIVTALPLLVSSSTIQQCSHHPASPHFSPVLDSLQCYNDFTTHIRCTWEEDPLTPLHLSVRNGQSPCVSDSLPALLPSGKTFRSCIYKTSLFSVVAHSFFYNVSCASKATVLNVAQQGKVSTPINLTVSEGEDEGRVLRWGSPYSPSSKRTLTYQLKYRRHGHDWTVVKNLTSSELVIEKTALLPGYLYEARVRAHGDVGTWSDWSPPVSWMIEKVGVLNLQCVMVNKGLVCGWQVKREHAQVLSYHLCWRKAGEPQKCEHCTIQAGELERTDALVDFTCSVVSSTPELLTVEIQTRRLTKDFMNTLYLHLPCPPSVRVENRNDLWKVTWSKPQVNDKIEPTYQVCVRRSDAQTHENTIYNITGIIFSFEIPNNFLLYQTQYVVQVRTLPDRECSGKPSNWSKPAYFTTGSAPQTSTFIYIFIGVFVLVLFIILYKALPSCHRRVELWKVSIPSPIKSKVLEDMSIRKSPVGWALSVNEKNSVCVLQSSDNPIIYEGSILECPLLPYLDDSSGNISITKADWTHASKGSSSKEDSSMADTSGMSFVGPYILCCQESVSASEASDPCSSLSSYDEENMSAHKSTSDSSAGKGVYVFSPPTFLPSTDDHAHRGVSTQSSLSELQVDSPPAYSPSSAGIPFSHPSGYCLMPRMDLSVAVWAQASGPPPESARETHSSKDAEGDEHTRSYVTLSQPQS
ncbi:cytokine receptor common subunit beta [Brachyhypopomus gauderio]|uniref:cytokine receptor common subunit beta n=1 Tax=Brachyhypopomus gauderio TaxID=698409 RepID=UPI004041913B